MNNRKIICTLITAGAFLFNSIFWNEQLGLNTLLFDAFIIGSIFYLYRNAIANTTVRWLLLSHLVSLFTLIACNSAVSKIACCATLLLLVSFAAYRHRSVWLAVGSLLLAFTQFTGAFFRLMQNRTQGQVRKKPVRRILRFAIFPLLIATCFIIIYSSANTVFAGLAAAITEQTERMFKNFFQLFSFSRLLFLFFGLYLTGTLLLRAAHTRFEQRDAAALDNMPRVRKKRMDIHRNLAYDLTVCVMGKLAKGPMALRNEYKTGLISLVLLNALLLVINSIDINYLWIHFNYNPSVDLYTMIHEGTELLILSIVMAMLVLLIFFRGNLNFYRNNKWLKAGAYCWLLQNAFLVLSVLLRDYYYIREFGLAYKRIGVLFFLLLVIAGLVTVFLKIRFAKTTYYLLRVNAWCVIILLVTGSLVQWDVFITEYNIAHRRTAPLNLPYLLTLSDKVLPVLHTNLPILKEREKELNAKEIYMGRCSNCIEAVIQQRVNIYNETQQKYSWLSWNYTDAQEKAYFLSKPAQVAMYR